MTAIRGPNKSAAEFVGDHLSCYNAAAPTKNYDMYAQCMLANGHIINTQVAGAAGNTTPAPSPATAAVTRTAAEGGPPNSVDDFRAATTDMRSGNYAEAMLLFRRIDAGQDIPAEAGGRYNKLTYQEILTETRTFIGDMNERGLGVPQDYKAARYWYQKAIDTGGSSMASARLARLYEQGLGGAKDHQKYLRLDPIQSVKEKEAEERREAEEAAREEARAAAERKANPQYARQQCESGCSLAATLCENNKSFGSFAFWAYPGGGGMFRGMAAADAMRDCSSQRASCLDSCTR
jgi:TPR repeat protein